MTKKERKFKYITTIDTIGHKNNEKNTKIPDGILRK